MKREDAGNKNLCGHMQKVEEMKMKKKCEFLDSYGTFCLEKPEETSYLYFPVANEAGIMSSVTPLLGGDSKTSQNTFVLAPVSAEELHNNKSSRNFWCITDQGLWSATGMSAETQAFRYTDMEEESSLEAGVLWQKVSRKSRKYPLASEILSFAPLNEDKVEIMKVTITNTGKEAIAFTPVAAVPVYGRSADNYRDHRHVTSLLHRIATTEYGVVIDPTLTFDERGHQKNKLLKAYCETCKHTVSGRQVELPIEELAVNLKEKAQWLNQNIRDNEWIEGENEGWFNGYYDNHSRRVEGYFESGARMMLTSQVFTLMNGAATKEQAEKMIQAADHYLYEKGVGGYKLNSNFHEIKDDLGRMFGFAYGHKENGVVFSHMCTMYANALYTRGFVQAGWKVIQALYEQAADFNTSCIYPGIPEYFSDKGRGLYHYLTGSASWLMLTVISEIFGVKGELGQLKVAPKLLLEQFDEAHQISLQMNFQGVPVRVTYQNPQAIEYGTYKIVKVAVDGQEQTVTGDDTEWIMPAEVLASMDVDQVHDVVVVLG